MADDTIPPLPPGFQLEDAPVAPAAPALTPTAQVDPTPAPVGAPSDDPPLPAGFVEEKSDAPAPASATPAQQQSPYMSSDDMAGRMGLMWANPHVTTQQMRDFWTQQGRQLPESMDSAFKQREAMIAKGQNPAGSVKFVPEEMPAAGSGPVNNKERSFWAGFSDGGEHVGENVVGAAGWLANKVGLVNDWHGKLHDWYQAKVDASPYQGTGYGNFVGELAGGGAGGLIAAPALETAGIGAGAAGGLRALGYAVDGGIQGGLTTQATTPGGVARDMAIGSVASAGLGSAAHAAGNAFMAGSKGASQAAEQFAAAQRLHASTGVDLAPGLAETGGYGSRIAAAGVGEGLVGGQMLGNRAIARNGLMEQVRNQAADTLAPAGETAQPLQAVRGQAQGDLADFDSRAADQERIAYDGARALVPKGTTIKAPQLLAAVNAKITELKSVPNWQLDSRVSYFTSLAKSLKKNTYTPQGLRDLRTSIYNNMTDKASARQTWGQLSGPLSRDIDGGLRAQGLDQAADAYRAADAAHGPLMQARSDVDKVVGKTNNASEEAVGSRLTSMLNDRTGDADRFSRTLAQMDPDVAARTRAAMVRGLGQTKPGVANGESAFSPSTFLTNWNDQNFSQRAKAALIPDAAVRSQLDDLATIAQGSRRAMGRANNSHSAGALNVLHVLGGLFSGHLALGSTGLSLAGEAAAAKTLTSPAMAKAAMMARQVAQPVITGTGYVAAKAGQKAVPIANGFLMGPDKVIDQRRQP